MDIAHDFLSTRRGTVILGVSAAALAGIVLAVYLHSYRSSLKSSGAPAPVLVAKHLIQQGTPGGIIALRRNSHLDYVPKGQLRDGALTDAASLTGFVAARDIYAGQQLTAADLSLAPPNSVQSKMTGTYRAINVTTDAEHGMLGQISAGDHLDVYIGLSLQGAGGNQPIIKLLMSDVLVLRAPITGGGQLTLRARGRQAAALAYAADNGRLWFVLRPASGAKNVNPGIINTQALLNTKPVR